MAFDLVYSDDPPIVITEDDDGYFHIYLEGELCGLAFTEREAIFVADEIFDSIHGDPLEESPEE